MRRIAKLLTFVMIMSTALVGCGASKTTGEGTTQGTTVQEATTQGDAQATDTSLEDIKAKGEFVLGLDTSLPPMGFMDEDQNVVGYDIDLAQEVCKRMGVKLKIQPINWDAKDQELNTKNIDCIWNGYTANPDRLANNQCTSTYMKNTQVAVVLADSEYETLEDLAGKVVEVQKGSTAVAALDENPEFKNSLKDKTPILIGDNVKALMDLGLGCDAVVMDEVVARYYTEKKAGEYRILDTTLAEEDYVIGFRKGEVALSQEVENQLKAMVEDGTMAAIDKKWFGTDVSTINQ